MQKKIASAKTTMFFEWPIIVRNIISWIVIFRTVQNVTQIVYLSVMKVFGKFLEFRKFVSKTRIQKLRKLLDLV